ncbi:MAG: ABZJ_00895 family protein [Pseudomonadota bacterium]
MTDNDILKRYALVTLATMVGVYVLSYALEALAGISVGAGVGIVTAIVPAMDAGQTFARKTAGALDSGRMWRLALNGTFINFGISLALTAAVVVVFQVPMAALVATLGAVGLLIILALFFVFYLLSARVFIGMGQRIELKRQAKAEE